MNDLLIVLDSDIKRCEDVLKLNNYLEIVIAIEELQDKHKEYLDSDLSSSNNVWSYTKKDLENIMNKLKDHRDKFINDYNSFRLDNKSIDLEVNFEKTVYESENLFLKILDKTNGQLVLDYYLRNKDFLQEWESEREEKFYTKFYQEEKLKNDLSNMVDGNLFRLWIFKKDNPTKIIGSIEFSNIIKGPFLSCFLGYKLDKDEINKGYMTQAIDVCVDIMFNQFGLHRIEANIMPNNKSSLKVVEKLGFYNEGIAYKYLKINGKWEDHIHMVLLNDKV